MFRASPGEGRLLVARGSSIVTREVQADDIGALTGFLTRLSARTCHQRYLAARSFTLATAHTEAARIAGARTHDHVALVAVTPSFGVDDMAGVAELARLDGEGDVGELAVVVRDDMQGAGIGSLLAHASAAAAVRLGIHTLHIELLADNEAMRRLAAHIGEPVIIGRSGGLLQLRVRLDVEDAHERRRFARWLGLGATKRAA